MTGNCIQYTDYFPPCVCICVCVCVCVCVRLAGCGIRLEDNVLVTEDGRDVLNSTTPAPSHHGN